MSDAVGDQVARLAERLAAAGIAAPRREARLLVAHAVGLAPLRLVTDPGRVVTAAEAAAIAEMAGRRARREPLARIVGTREFWSLEFRLSPATLDPRPDSETLVQALLDAQPDRARPLRLLDLGTGSGCLLVALLAELPAAWGIGVDLAPEAAATARANAARLGFADRARFVAGDWGQALRGGFDAIAVNPPYIEDAAIASLEPEVANWEPRLALAGGPDGLDPLRRLAPEVFRLLVPGGRAAIEVGAGQSAPAGKIVAAAGLDLLELRRDLAGIERCLVVARQ